MLGTDKTCVLKETQREKDEEAFGDFFKNSYPKMNYWCSNELQLEKNQIWLQILEKLKI